MRFYGPDGTERLKSIKESYKNIIYAFASPAHHHFKKWSDSGFKLSKEEYGDALLTKLIPPNAGDGDIAFLLECIGVEDRF